MCHHQMALPFYSRMRRFHSHAKSRAPNPNKNSRRLLHSRCPPNFLANFAPTPTNDAAMSLWVDRHRPRELARLDYHRPQAAQLLNLTQQGDFPHLMFYGPSGAGKKTRVMCLLRELYGPGVERLRSETMTFTTPSNKKIDIMTVGSNYHLEVNPSDAGIYDRVVVVELIKQVAQTHQLDAGGQRDFKCIVLSEVDDLTKDAQHALRRTMEKYMATCRIILCVQSTARVIPAIRSRCLGIRVAAPTAEEIVQVLQQTAKKETLTVPHELAARIAVKSGRNLRRALLMLESCKVQQYPFTAAQPISELDWQVWNCSLSIELSICVYSSCLDKKN